MQVQPIAAISPMHIRPKPVTAVPETRKQTTAPTTPFPSANEIMLQDQRGSSQVIGYHAAQSEYSAQMVANRLNAGQTQMDRSSHFAQYNSASQHASATATISVTV
ncbi:MAG: hypothetical protein ABJL55_05870 [Roseibium sp.]